MVPRVCAVFAIPNTTSRSSEIDACILHLKSLAGLYLRAFLQGIEQIMDSYRDAIVSIETDALLQPHSAFSLVKVNDTLKQVRIRFFWINSHACLFTLVCRHSVSLFQATYSNSRGLLSFKQCAVFANMVCTVSANRPALARPAQIQRRIAHRPCAQWQRSKFRPRLCRNSNVCLSFHPMLPVEFICSCYIPSLCHLFFIPLTAFVRSAAKSFGTS